MPIYEYVCGECRESFELLIRGQERAECPTCQSHQVERQLSVPAAPASSTQRSLPVCPPPSSGNCGLPQCGGGGCWQG